MQKLTGWRRHWPVCDLYGKVCQALAQAGSDGLSRLSCELQELVDSEEVELSPWEAGA